jgi:hypothetical protein
VAVRIPPPGRSVRLAVNRARWNPARGIALSRICGAASGNGCPDRKSLRQTSCDGVDHRLRSSSSLRRAAFNIARQKVCVLHPAMLSFDDAPHPVQTAVGEANQLKYRGCIDALYC